MGSWSVTKYLVESPALRSLASDFAFGHQFAAWIGSGTSLASGLPSWKSLRNSLQATLGQYLKRPGITTDAAEAQRITESIARIPDPWDAFEALQGRLPRTTYQNLVRQKLGTEQVAEPPETLVRLWHNPNVKGFVSLNLDNLAERACAAAFSGKRSPSIAHGYNLTLAKRLLSDRGPFLVQLHGILSDESTWVFTRSEKQKLFEQELYKDFVSACLSAKKTLFIGCSPDDEAVAQHFDKLKSWGAKLPNSYWFVASHELSAERRATVDAMNISLVEYDIDTSASAAEQTAQHSAAILELLDYVEQMRQLDVEPDPINPGAPPAAQKFPPDVVQGYRPEQARNVLSRYASAILEGPEERRLQDYEAFTREYSTAIAVACDVKKEPGEVLFGYKFIEDIGGGAFSRVFRVTDGVNERALKLVRSDVREDPTMLRSFRRGVSSMRIVAERSAAGMVQYVIAYEIPACVVMEFIDGDNLEIAASRHSFDFVEQGLPIAKRVAEIVRSAHDLPERVLHRDLRPSNIMLRNGDVADRVVVLDFDLSWHEGADADAAISPNMTTVLAYLAPEQLSQASTGSARQTKVDSYGLCMTLLYMIQRQHPDFQLRRSSEWERFKNSIGANLDRRVRWRSWLPRLRRLIHAGTEPDFAARLDFVTVAEEIRVLELLSRASLEDLAAASGAWAPLDAIAEEVLAVACATNQYEWDSLQESGVHTGVRGIAMKVASETKGKRGVRLSAVKDYDASESFEAVRKYWKPRTQEIQALMEAAGWTTLQAKASHYQTVEIEFFVSEEDLFGAARRLADAGARAWALLNR